MSIGDRVAVMNRGQLLQLDTPLRVYQWPASLWVARFIGTHPINVLNVTVDGGRMVTEGEAPMALGAPSDFLKVGLTPTKLALGIRPESLSLLSAQGASDVSLRAGVVIRQVMGNIILYELEFANGLRLRALTPSAHDYAVGEHVSVGIQWGSVRLYDRETGLLIGPEPSTAQVA